MTSTFTQTSSDPYLRHFYKVVAFNGESVVFDNYEDAQRTWWGTPGESLSHIEVIDPPQKKTKGFK